SSRAATRRSVSLTQSDRGISLLQESSATPRVAAGRAGAAAGRSARAMTPNQRTESIIPPTDRVKTSRLSTALVFENEKGAGRAGAPVVGVATRSVARRQLAVELALRRALLELLVGALELLVDHALEGLEGLRTGDEATVDEEGRGAASAHPVGVGGVAVDVVAVLARVERGPELLHVEADLLGPLLVVLTGELPLVGEELVVHLPELALLVGRHRRLGRGLGVAVEAQRQVPEDEAHVVAVGLQDLVDGRVDARAVGALEVG